MASEKLVSADGLREWLKKIPLHDLSDGRGLCRIIFAEDFEKAMASFPGETLQIVRCKDCEFSRELTKTEKRIWLDECRACENPKASQSGYMIVFPEHFCSYGERMEE